MTIVTPCFNQERFVEPAIVSVRSQTEERWELLVVDDGSSDHSVAVATKAASGDARVRVLEMPHRGVNHARNAGLAAAASSSRYLLFFDADDALDASMLERFVEELDANPQVSMVHSLVTLIDEAGHVLPSSSQMPPRYVADRWGVRTLDDSERETPFASILALAGIIPSCTMIRRAALGAAEGWDETFGQGFEDTDLFLRLALNGPVHLIPERLVRHRRHPSQSSQAPGRHEAQIIKLHARWRDLDRLTLDQRAVVLDAWRFYDRQLNWYMARSAARRLLRERRLLRAGRYLAGAMRITLRSWRAQAGR